MKFRSFLKMLNTRKNCDVLVLDRSNGDVTISRFTRECIDVRHCGENCWLVLYKRDVLDILGIQVFMTEDEEYFFSICEFEGSNGDGVRFHFVISCWFKDVQR